jgi:hypothetical protein
MLHIIKKIKTSLFKINKLDDKLNSLMLLQSKFLRSQNWQNQKNILEDIQKAEYKVFSQYGDDGIIQFLVDYLDINKKSFIEFGVENYLESNTRYLLLENNWEGLIIDGNKKNMDFVKKDNLYWRHSLTAIHSFVTAENINTILTSAGFNGEVGLLHIDIDGNDYWIWNAITCIEPSIVIIEYNSLFGYKRSITVPYNPSFFRTQAHYSNLYYGASLKALIGLSSKKGYEFIGCNAAGNNAYFVKKTLLKDIQPRTIDDGYVKAKFRESRDKSGKLTYYNSDKQLELIKGLPVYDTLEEKNTLI